MTRDRHAVLDRIRDQVPSTDDAFERLAAARERRARRARLSATAVGIALAGALVVAVVGLWVARETDEEERDVRPAGNDAPRLVARDGEYYYQRAVWFGDNALNPQSDVPLDEAVSRVEMWIGPDGSGRVLRKPEYAPERRTTDERYAVGQLPAGWTVALPDDADAFLAALIERSGPQGASPVAIATTSPGRTEEMTAVLRAMQDLLTFGSGILTPSQQAALLEAAGTVADVTTEVDAVDPLGRPAIRLTYVINYDIGEGSTVEWYVEPSTGQFLAELWVDRASGRVESAFLVEAAGITRSVDETPHESDLYVPEGNGSPSFSARV